MTNGNPDDRRSTVSSATKDPDGNISTLWSINPGATKTVVSILGGIVVLFVALFGGLTFVIGHEFDERLHIVQGDAVFRRRAGDVRHALHFTQRFGFDGFRHARGLDPFP